MHLNQQLYQCQKVNYNTSRDCYHDGRGQVLQDSLAWSRKDCQLRLCPQAWPWFLWVFQLVLVKAKAMVRFFLSRKGSRGRDSDLTNMSTTNIRKTKAFDLAMHAISTQAPKTPNEMISTLKLQKFLMKWLVFWGLLIYSSQISSFSSILN